MKQIDGKSISGLQDIIMTKAFVFFVVIIIAATFSSTCSAIELNKNGFEIEIYHKEKSDGLHVWGNVEEGRDCKQLNLTIFFRNGDSAEIARIVTAVKNYSGGMRATYKGVDEVYRDGSKKKWFVDEVYTKCLN